MQPNNESSKTEPNGGASHSLRTELTLETSELPNELLSRVGAVPNFGFDF